MNTRLLFVVCCSLILVSMFGLQQSFAVPATTVFFSSPNPDNPITSNNIISFTGGFTDDLTSSPTITLAIDDQPKAFVSLGVFTWSYTKTLASGWHVATISMFDGKVIRSSTLSFLVSLGHTTTTKYNLLLVVPSEACTKLLQYNKSSNCPTTEKLIPFDTTKGAYGSGQFVKNNKGQMERTKPMVKNYWVFFNLLPYKPVCIDCFFDFGKADTVQIIFLEPGNFSYALPIPLPTNSLQITPSNSTILVNELGEKSNTISYNKFVSKDCTTANISFTPVMLADTINYMMHGCTGTTINMTSTAPAKVTQVDPTNSQDFRNQQWLDTVKKNISSHNCTTSIIKCKPIKDHNSKW